jgi:protein ImuB
MGQAPETIMACHVPPDYAADFMFEAPLSNREAIEHALAQLLSQVVEPLARRREGALRLACRLKYEQGGEEEGKPESHTNRALAEPVAHAFAFSLGLFRPSASADYLRDLLRLRLESVRLAGPVTSIHVEVTAIGPLELTQQALFEEDQNQEQPRRLAELVDRLSNRLGRNAVVQVALLPEAQPEYTCVDVPLEGGAASVGNGHRTSSVGNALRGIPEARDLAMSTRPTERHRGRSLQNFGTKKQTKKKPKKNLAHVSRYGLLSFAPDERPLCLLPQPARIEVIAIAPDGVPARFRGLGRSYSIAYAWGPERIETGWWRTAEANGANGSKRRESFLVRRDYYRVETTSGARFWIFRQLGDRAWFLHGTFE